jgi:hypothetical protein
MIRYRLNERIDLAVAATCTHPALVRLQGRRWQARQEGNSTILTRADHLDRTDWGPWKPGLGGLEFSVPDPLPAFSIQDWNPTQPSDARVVKLKNGASVLVAPAYLDGGELLLDGTIAAPTSRYARLVTQLWDRTVDGGLAATDPDVVAFARLAIQSCMLIPDEAIHAWHLLSSADVQALFDAATALPKAEAGAPG